MDLQIKIYVIFLLSLPLFSLLLLLLLLSYTSLIVHRVLLAQLLPLLLCCASASQKEKDKFVFLMTFLSLLSFFDVSTLQGIIIFDLALGFILQESESHETRNSKLTNNNANNTI